MCYNLKPMVEKDFYLMSPHEKIKSDLINKAPHEKLGIHKAKEVGKKLGVGNGLFASPFELMRQFHEKGIERK